MQVIDNISNNTTPRRNITFARGKGARFWDATGKEYVDLSSQTLNLLFGQVHPAIHAAVVSEIANCTFITQDFLNPRILEAIELLKTILPVGLVSFNLRMNDGSDAVEAAVKAARRYSGKSKVITSDKIFLGSNTQSINLRGLDPKPRDIVLGTSEDVIFVPAPYCEDSHDISACPKENGELFCEYIERYKNDIACVLLDPILISSGIAGGKGFGRYLRCIERKCKECNLILIVDECQSFGWVPDFLLCNHYGIDVDMLVLGKGIAGGFPLAACITKKQFDVLNFCEADYTYGGHPISIAALCATLRLLYDSKEQFEITESLLVRFLNELAARFPVKHRGIGLIRCLELSEVAGISPTALSKQVSQMLQERGVYIRPYVNTVVIKPPLVITSDEMNFAFEEIFKVLTIIYET